MFNSHEHKLHVAKELIFVPLFDYILLVCSLMTFVSIYYFISYTVWVCVCVSMRCKLVHQHGCEHTCLCTILLENIIFFMSPARLMSQNLNYDHAIKKGGKNCMLTRIFTITMYTLHLIKYI